MTPEQRQARILSLVADGLKLIAAGGDKQAAGALREAAHLLERLDIPHAPGRAQHPFAENTRARILYLEQALTPGSPINAQTTFYEGKGEAMRAELKALREQEQP